MKLKIERNGYEIAEHKYRLIYRAVRRLNDEFAKMPKEQLERQIDQSLFWKYPDQPYHQVWLKTASIDEIALWLKDDMR